jgi:sialidase-1
VRTMSHGLSLLYAFGIQPHTQTLRHDLFVPTPRYPCFRQPMILSPAPNVLLAFAENRNVSACAPAYSSTGLAPAYTSAGLTPSEIGSLLLRRSKDGGRTWTELQTVYASSAPGIDFYVGVHDRVRQRCWLFLQEAQRTLVFTSDDLGARWSAPRDFASWNASRTLPLPLREGAKPAVGHGLQLSSGRLVLPFVCRNASAAGSHTDRSCATCNACVLLSDDGGASFRFGGVGQPGSRESQLVEISPAEIGSSASEIGSSASEIGSSQIGAAASQLYLNARNMGGHPGTRMVARSSDSGESLHGFARDGQLVTPVTPSWTGVVASVVSAGGRHAGSDAGHQADAGSDAGHHAGSDAGHHAGSDAGAPATIVYSSASDPTARCNLSLRLSHDGGTSWSSASTLWSGPAAYSDLARLNGTHVVVIYENGDATFADRVSVSVVPLAWIGKRATLV